LLLCAFAGAATGKDAHPRRERESILRTVGLSAKHALLSPWTWGPAAASVVFYASGLDPVVSDWAMSNTPVYGSMAAASEASDFFQRMSHIGFYGSTLFAYATTMPRPGITGAALGIGGSYGAIALTAALTGAGKSSVGRLRPNESDTRSFPSGHTSNATVHATLACRNVDMMPMPRATRLLLQGALVSTAVATAWGRVEGGHHFPSDVLAGAALGHFVGAFASELIWRLGFPVRATIMPAFSRDAFSVEVSVPIPDGRRR
jgi:membrane-associated phospholipid phosphatase